MLTYVMDKYHPDLLMAGFPTTDEFQHQFLGLVSPKLPNGANNPAYDDVESNGTPDGRVAQREAFLQAAYKGADATLTTARALAGGNPTTFISSDHGFGPQFLAIDASTPLVNLGLLSTPQRSNCRLNTNPASGPVATIGKAKACWAGGALQIYLNLATRDPASSFSQVALADQTATVNQIRAAYQNLVDPNDWTGDGQPEGWKVIDRTFTKAEARYIPNGPNSTADMAHPTRTGVLVVFAYPPCSSTPRRRDTDRPVAVLRPAPLGAGRPGPRGEHRHAGDVHRRRPGHRQGQRGGADDGSGTDPRVVLGVPEPQQGQGRVLTRSSRSDSIRPISIIGLTDFHRQLGSRPGARWTTRQRARRRRGRPGTMLDEECGPAGPGLLVAFGDNVGASPANGPVPGQAAIDVENAWGLGATSLGNHEFDYGVARLQEARRRAPTSRSSRQTSSRRHRQHPRLPPAVKVFTMNGIQVGVIGAELKSTPELVWPTPRPA